MKYFDKVSLSLSLSPTHYEEEACIYLYDTGAHFGKDLWDCVPVFLDSCISCTLLLVGEQYRSWNNFITVENYVHFLLMDLNHLMVKYPIVK